MRDACALNCNIQHSLSVHGLNKPRWRRSITTRKAGPSPWSMAIRPHALLPMMRSRGCRGSPLTPMGPRMTRLTASPITAPRSWSRRPQPTALTTSPWGRRLTTVAPPLRDVVQWRLLRMRRSQSVYDGKNGGGALIAAREGAHMRSSPVLHRRNNGRFNSVAAAKKERKSIEK
jgi:hypothetical protein